MPYIVKSSLHNIKFPEQCAFCEKRNADSAIVGKYTKANGLFPLPLFTVLTWKEHKTGFPACVQCATLSTQLKTTGILIIIIPLVIYIAAYLFIWPFENLMLYVATVLSITGIGILCYRQWFLYKLRIGYIGSDGIYFYFRSKEYADAFANMNGLKSEYKFVFLRVR